LDAERGAEGSGGTPVGLICDLAFGLLITEQFQTYLADRQAALAAGAGEIPDWDKVRADFVEALAEPPDSELAVLRELGVA
jgi:hypothetical protein